MLEKTATVDVGKILPLFLKNFQRELFSNINSGGQASVGEMVPVSDAGTTSDSFHLAHGASQTGGKVVYFKSQLHSHRIRGRVGPALL